MVGGAMEDRHTGMKMAFVRDMIQIMRIIGEKKSMIRIQTRGIG